jgi:hypothetical protein
MLTYLSAVWAGTEDPFWPHLVLVPLSVVAGIAVGVGIVLERPKYCPAIHRIAFWLVVVGVAIESLCTVALFITDERISLALETEIAPRLLTAERGNELIALFEKFPGRTVRVSSYELDLESGVLGWQMLGAAKAAHLPTNPRLQSQDALGGELIGLSVTGTDAEMVSAVISLFRKFEFDPTEKPPPETAGLHAGGEGAPLPLKIFIGVKRPAWMPSG